MGVRLADPDRLEGAGANCEVGDGHALSMQITYPNASEIVCNPRDDTHSRRRHIADMENDQFVAGTEKNHLRAWRKYRRLTQQTLADMVGTTKAVISNLELDERGLSAKWLRRLAKALGTTPGFLLDHDPNDLNTDVLEIWASIDEESRPQALKILTTFKRTGTTD